MAPTSIQLSHIARGVSSHHNAPLCLPSPACLPRPAPLLPPCCLRCFSPSPPAAAEHCRGGGQDSRHLHRPLGAARRGAPVCVQQGRHLQVQRHHLPPHLPLRDVLPRGIPLLPAPGASDPGGLLGCWAGLGAREASPGTYQTSIQPGCYLLLPCPSSAASQLSPGLPGCCRRAWPGGASSPPSAAWAPPQRWCLCWPWRRSRRSGRM